MSNVIEYMLEHNVKLEQECVLYEKECCGIMDKRGVADELKRRVN